MNLNTFFLEPRVHLFKHYSFTEESYSCQLNVFVSLMMDEYGDGFYVANAANSPYQLIYNP
jgi:hypothetical protein